MKKEKPRLILSKDDNIGTSIFKITSVVFPDAKASDALKLIRMIEDLLVERGVVDKHRFSLK